MVKKASTSKNEDDIEKVEDFYGVYLLVSQNPKYKGRTYVGFTVDPERRLKQHNGGREAGGACKTSNRGPWAMIMIVHGFPNMISALRFEWAWQHPKRSRRLNQVPPKKKSEKLVVYHVRLLSEMLSTGPWCRLPLSIRWLRPDLKGDLDFPRDKQPPIHMPILYGPVKSVKLKKKKKKANPDDNEELNRSLTPLLCGLCFETVPSLDQVQCLSPKCASVYHMVCLSTDFCQKSNESRTFFLPIDGHCPVCNVFTLWGDIIRKKKGCYQDVNNFEPTPTTPTKINLAQSQKEEEEEEEDMFLDSDDD